MSDPKIKTCPDVASAILGTKGVTIKTDKESVGGTDADGYVQTLHNKAIWSCDPNGICLDKKNGRKIQLNALLPSGLLSKHGDGTPVKPKDLQKIDLAFCLNKNLSPGGDWFIQRGKNGGLGNVIAEPDGGLTIIASNKSYHENPNVHQDSGQVKYITYQIKKKK